jgi:F5/8 type C domain
LEYGTVTAKLTSAIAQTLTVGLPPGVANARLTVEGTAQEISELGAGKRGCQVTLPKGTSVLSASFDPPELPSSPHPLPPSLLVSKGRPVTASSIRTEDGDVGVANVVDGDETTRWTSAYQDNQWICVDLGSSRTIKEIKLDWESATGRDYDIEVSNDAQVWTTVKSIRGNSQTGWLDYPDLQAQGRYVRINCKVRATEYGFSLWEFQVFGS